MTSRRRSIGMWLGFLCAAAMQPACGGSDLECGGTTTNQGGKCVPNISDCGPGAVLEKGVCVQKCSPSEQWTGTSCIALLKCGPGTVELDGGCVPSCLPSQMWNGLTCVPLPACAVGTKLNPQTSKCEPDATACAAGSHWDNGKCVTDLVCATGTHAESGKCIPDTIPPADVTESTIYDGAADFTLPASGDTITLGGVVDTPGGFSAPDWDRFRFTATAGTWLDIDAFSVGALKPAWVLQSDAVGSDGSPRYIRYALDQSTLHARREVYLPFDGTYELRITDYAHVVSGVFNSVGTIPVGGDDYAYAIHVKNLGTPIPEDVPTLPASKTGDLSSGALHFFSTPATTGKAFGVSSAGLPAPATDSDAFRAVMVFAPGGSFVGQSVAFQSYADAELPVVAAADGEYLVVQDYLLTIGARDDFALDLFSMDVTDCTSGGCASGSIPAQGNGLLRWDLKAGDFLTVGVYLPQTANEYVKVSLVDASMQPVVPDSAASPADVGMGYMYAEADTSAYLWLREWDGAAVPAYTVDARVAATPLIDDTKTYNGQPVFEMPPWTLRNAGIGHFAAKANQFVFFQNFATHPAGWAAPQEFMMTQRLDKMGPVIDVESWNFPDGYCTPVFSFIKDAGTYLHYVFDGGDPISGATYDVEMVAADTWDLKTPVVGTPVKAAGNLGKGLSLYTFTGVAHQYYEIKVAMKYTDWMPDLWVFNFGKPEFAYVTYEWVGDPRSPQVGLIKRETATVAGDVTVGYVSPYDGPTALMLQTATGSGSATDSYDISVTAPAPPPADACKNNDIPLTAGHGTVQGNSSAAINDVEYTGCTDYATHGPDNFYTVQAQDGDTLTVTLTTTEFSAALYLFKDCANIKGTCIASSESGSPRTIVYKVPTGQGGTFFIAADSHNVGGKFTLDVQVSAN